MRFVVIGLLVVAAVPAMAQQDDPVIAIRLRYSQWRAIGALVDEQKIKDFGAISNEVQNQMTAQAQAQQKAVVDAFEKQIRDKIDVETKTKTDKESPP